MIWGARLSRAILLPVSLTVHSVVLSWWMRWYGRSKTASLLRLLVTGHGWKAEMSYNMTGNTWKYRLSGMTVSALSDFLVVSPWTSGPRERGGFMTFSDLPLKSHSTHSDTVVLSECQVVQVSERQCFRSWMLPSADWVAVLSWSNKVFLPEPTNPTRRKVPNLQTKKQFKYFYDLLFYPQLYVFFWYKENVIMSENL